MNRPEGLPTPDTWDHDYYMQAMSTFAEAIIGIYRALRQAHIGILVDDLIAYHDIHRADGAESVETSQARDETFRRIQSLHEEFKTLLESSPYVQIVQVHIQPMPGGIPGPGGQN